MDRCRGDGRGPAECRPCFLRTGVVSGATGSAYGECGKTRAVLSVFGPRPRDKNTGSDSGDPHGMQLDCHVHVPFDGRGAEDDGGGEGMTEAETRLAKQLEQSILPSIRQEGLAKTCVEIHCTVLESDGSEVGPAIVCASFALASSRVPLHGLVTYCTASATGGRVLLDPTRSELEASEAVISAAYMASRDQVTFIEAAGNWSVHSFKDCLDTCLDGCKAMCEALRGSLFELGRKGESIKAEQAEPMDAVPSSPESWSEEGGAEEELSDCSDAALAPQEEGFEEFHSVMEEFHSVMEPRHDPVTMEGRSSEPEEPSVTKKLESMVVANEGAEDLDAELDALLDM